MMCKVSFRNDFSCTDFDTKRVVVQHLDGTRCEFVNAIVERDYIKRSNGSSLRVLKVYTEHTGNHFFYLDDLVYYRIESLRIKGFLRRIKKVLEYWKTL